MKSKEQKLLEKFLHEFEIRTDIMVTKFGTHPDVKELLKVAVETQVQKYNREIEAMYLKRKPPLLKRFWKYLWAGDESDELKTSESSLTGFNQSQATFDQTNNPQQRRTGTSNKQIDSTLSIADSSTKNTPVSQKRYSNDEHVSVPRPMRSTNVIKSKDPKLDLQEGYQTNSSGISTNQGSVNLGNPKHSVSDSDGDHISNDTYKSENEYNHEERIKESSELQPSHLHKKEINNLGRESSYSDSNEHLNEQVQNEENKVPDYGSNHTKNKPFGQGSEQTNSNVHLTNKKKGYENGSLNNIIDPKVMEIGNSSDPNQLTVDRLAEIQREINSIRISQSAEIESMISNYQSSSNFEKPSNDQINTKITDTKQSTINNEPKFLVASALNPYLNKDQDYVESFEIGNLIRGIILCDGVSNEGKASRELARRLPSEFIKVFKEEFDPKNDSLSQWESLLVSSINRACLNTELSGGATTFLVSVVANNRLFFGWVGDGHAIYFNKEFTGFSKLLFPQQDRKKNLKSAVTSFGILGKPVVTIQNLNGGTILMSSDGISFGSGKVLNHLYKKVLVPGSNSSEEEYNVLLKKWITANCCVDNNSRQDFHPTPTDDQSIIILHWAELEV